MTINHVSWIVQRQQKTAKCCGDNYIFVPPPPKSWYGIQVFGHKHSHQLNVNEQY
jgi:hypothetical protein